jgi:hypothetical protein
MSFVRAAVVWLGLASLLVAACSSSDGGGNGMSFVNHTDRTLLITYIDASGKEPAEPVVHSLAPGTRAVVNDRFVVNTCRDVTLVARAEDGAEVARLSGPICAPSEWVIEAGP